MATHKKIHSSKPHKATLKPKLAREYFFLPPKKNFFPPLLFLIKLFRHRTGFVRNRTESASNVNRFVDSVVHDIGQTHLRCEKSGDTHNKGLAKVAVQWLIEHLSFVLSVVLVDSFVLRIRHLRQAPNRYMPL